MPTQTKRGRRSKKATLHNKETKLAALDRVQRLMYNGTTRFRAQSIVAKELNVRPQTVINWFSKYNLVTEDHISTNHAVTSAGRLIIQSLNIKTADGKCVTLTPTDIKDIAKYESLV